ncbi:ankyrin repeat domain-containing protein [Geomobilimonas luticola]|uniref:Ankyrin repeat domain-containing protein n=1 Tax=Geomobilimonas luticola TaxID=1114878 RepID=A0ABS5SCH1_9BACT|nr:ankyrin repeat domain-containing protein [Geomobilimonas luticola]MBT0652306.1 ankyrin repeat domain-containing protein [Geomobilimonas luticola]
MKNFILFTAMTVLAISTPAYARDVATSIEDMTADLGVPAQHKKNNGKVLKCEHRGTKQVTLSSDNETTTYKATYLNCREKGTVRDGIFEIVKKGDEVVANTAKRSVNGELFDAVLANDTGKVKTLLKKKADVNYSESINKAKGGAIDEWTPLMSAVMNENTEMVKLLVGAGAWVNYMNSEAVNALWIAANKGNLPLVKYLVSRGAYIDNQGVDDMTPLMLAAINGNYALAKFLIKSRADLNLKHKEGDSALMFAVSRGHMEMAKLLIDSGANLNIQNKYGITALIIASVEGNSEIVEKLVNSKADQTLTTDFGKTALEIATAKGHTKIVELLTQHR